MCRFFFLFSILILGILFPLQALGEAPVLTLEQIQEYRKQKLEREARKALEARKELGQRFLHDYGGWYRFTSMFFDDLDNEAIHKKTRVLKLHDLRLWGLLNIDETHSLYFRERLDHTDFNPGSQFRRREDDLNIDIDQGYYTLRLDKALKRYFDGDIPLLLDITGGKFFTEIGNGLSYSRVAIGVEIQGQSRFADFKAFWFQTPPGEPNIDFSAPGYRTEGQTRDFTGVQITYPRLFNNHYPYFYFLLLSEPRQKYGYDSQYFGVGSRGKIIRTLNYEIEGVREVGRSYATTTTVERPEDITAWALDTRLENIFDVLTHPRVSFQYALGTGDKDRRLVTTTRFGNAPGSPDRNFLYFGYIDTGYVVSPRLSNLQMLRFGLALSPLESTKRYKKSLELGANYYVFHKYTKTGGISDFRADRNLGSLGEEIDVYVNWKVVSDIFLNLNYGRFYPSILTEIKMQGTSSSSASISNFSLTRWSFKTAILIPMVTALIVLFPSNSTAQTPLLRELEDKGIATFEDGCRGIAAFLHLPVATGTFEQVLEELKKRKIVRNKWAKADEPLTWGRMSYMVCRALDIRGGLVMTAIEGPLSDMPSGNAWTVVLCHGKETRPDTSLGLT